MHIKRPTPIIAVLCFCVGVVSSAQNTRSDARQNRMKAAQIQRQTQKIERLSQQLSEARQKLEELQHGALDKPQNSLSTIAPKIANISWITGSIQGVERGKIDGFRASDRLIVLERTKPQIDLLAPETHDHAALFHPQVVVKGYCVIQHLYDKDMTLIPVHNAGIRPEDEVYILNRDDSSYSFASANF